MAAEPTAVVTGAAGGIGSAICEKFRRVGWRVHGIDNHWRKSPTADDLVVDLRDADAIADALGGFRAVHALVNNAALMWTRPLLEANEDALDDLFAVNLRAPIVIMRALHPALEAVGGSITNVASVHAIATSQGAGPYAAAKGGLVALTRSAALEFAPTVRVNAVLPGAIGTAMLEEGLSRDPESAKRLIARTPLRRVGRPGEVAEAVLFLSDVERASFITGQTLVVDGGALARLGTE